MIENMADQSWNYDTAFSRNLGLINESEQAQLRNFRIAIAGMGGVGGVHLITLLRMGFEKFNICDFDTFEVGNFNRQYGASLTNLGKNKAETMAALGREINPMADIKVFTEPLKKETVPQFLSGCQVYVDGMDAFEIRVRRELFMRARESGLYSVSAGPIGFSVASMVFSPHGMSFDRYFGYDEAESDLMLFARFLAGLCPKSLQRPYMDKSRIDPKNHRGPSSALACQLCAGVMGAEVLKIALKRGPIRPAPYFQQFDAYRGKLATGRRWCGKWNPRFRFLASRIYRMLSKQLATPEHAEL